MVKTPPTHVFDGAHASAMIDPDDPSMGQATFLTETSWYHFRLSREALQRLAREIEQALQASSPEFRKN